MGLLYEEDPSGRTVVAFIETFSCRSILPGLVSATSAPQHDRLSSAKAWAEDDWDDDDDDEEDEDWDDDEDEEDEDWDDDDDDEEEDWDDDEDEEEDDEEDD